MLLIIRCIINRYEYTIIFETFNKHSYLVLIAKSHWSMNCFKSLFPAPIFNSLK